MQCKCGPEMTEGTHIVTTEKGKLKWLGYAPESDIDVQQWECKHCGRVRCKVYCDQKCIKDFG